MPTYTSSYRLPYSDRLVCFPHTLDLSQLAACTVSPMPTSRFIAEGA